jgi:large subunit ribosomal protein L33
MGEVAEGVGNMRVNVTLACTECKNRNYISEKNKRKNTERLEMKKFCKFCNTHTLHRETK